MKDSLLRPGERLDDLRGGMRIIQDPAAPCFSVDAVLLADFVRVRPNEIVVDLGCGTGVLPLLLLAKEPSLSIRGAELMLDMADLARRNMELNRVEDRVRVDHADLRGLSASWGRSVADVVVSNPPFFKEGQGRPNQDPLFAAARSERFCTLDQLLDAARDLLRPLGRLYLVHRAERLGELAQALENRRLRLTTFRAVQPQAEAAANLLLAEAVKEGRAPTRVLPPLIVYQEPGRFSREMEAIYAGETLPGSHAHR